MTALAQRQHGPSSRAERRSPAVRRAWIAGAGVTLVIVVIASLAVGARAVPPGEVLGALFSPSGTENEEVVREFRLPRTILGLLAGAALGAAGAIMQGLTRNPLADPGVLGVNAGASFAVVVAIVGFGIDSPSGYVWFAFAGAAASATAVYLLGSTGRGGATPVRLALAGVSASVFLGAVTSALTLTDTQVLDEYRYWVVGALAGRDSTLVGQVTPFLLAGLVLAIACGRTLDSLALGDDVARSLGQRLWAGRALCAAAVTVLTGAAVSAAGPIGFVGLVVPHAARTLVGLDHRVVVTFSALLGAILLLTADIAGRVVASPGELQVGIVTAAIGAPVFIVFVRRRKVLG
ncbi:iron ABC transporter permease [Planomonospora sp. ID67723]|uniref:FecCD family ABC transporter permease n=1 Tax=Planomonospora sp. ID67723 TaxID=2738134 RepID=UPI001A22E3E8|nr:iron ABC transporter permease [Planomonospora sp. ID67723]MBG0829780.1 iron ABC transporter permease [Planomonospora sp. ID67723]